MYNPDQSSYTDGTYYYVQQPHSYVPNPNPNPNLYPHSAESYYCSPGVDPYAYSSSYAPAPPGVYEAQTANYHERNAAPQNWVVKEAAPVTYSTAIKSASATAVATSSSNPQLGSNQINVPLANMAAPSYEPVLSGYQTNPALLNNPQTRVQNPANATHVVRCELCNIDCNNLDAYQMHLCGKKHKTNLQTRYAPTVTPQPKNVHPGHMGITGVPNVPNGSELDKKKQMLVKVGASEDSVKVCVVCNVACNSEVAFADHISGKKHIAQVGMVSGSVGMPYVAGNQNPMTKPRVISTQRKTPKEAKPAQSAWCEICNISCNNTEVLNIHRGGKKHLKNVEKLQPPKSEQNSNGEHSNTSVSANPLTSGPIENPESGKDSSDATETLKRKQMAQAPEGLEVKKQKTMKDGADAKAARMCTVCNVFCNSEIVYNSHISGKKHATMVLEQAKARAKANSAAT